MSSENHEDALVVSDLHVSYVSGIWKTPVVKGVSLTVPKGQTLALVGESGSGKSTLAAAAAGLLAENGRIDSGLVEVAGHQTVGFTQKQWRRLRGRNVGFVPQDPLSSLDPLQRIGDQVADAVALHRGVGREEARREAVSLLDSVGIRDAAGRARAYPHQLSGGQLQRVLIATAVAGRPQLLIADEPTSALDVTVQRTILDLLDSLKAQLGLSILLITHDLSVAQERSEHTVVLQHGEIRDAGPTEEVVATPTHEYTRQLFADAPALNPGKYRTASKPQGAEDEAAVNEAVSTGAPVISVADLTKHYGGSAAPALDRIGFEVQQGSIHALVGESGSGKTTAARIIAGLLGYDSGQVHVSGRQRPRDPGVRNRRPEELQLVYQNPLAAFDPRQSIRAALEEPLTIRGDADRRQRRRRVEELLEQVGLDPALGVRTAGQLSGGQRQRAAIARALILQPRILILDEPTSALDVTVQAQLIDLLMRLRTEQGLTYLFISHDLSLVRQIADEVTVLERGQLVESGPADRLFADPQHPYTRRLLESIPGPGRITGPSVGAGVPGRESPSSAERTAAALSAA
ncbi:ABC transporter ATP-binding protein [Nesterenkonia massiliensis]|uniref:ABC transporter ATP-binding protein n=1 Tax=Nesterenkonia massiliensis TaxID=1232429 RepID=A0ABT2HNV7_9MICC|nr:ABC transporter ATP-binding protein [Nesterenkonia massiliensis]MCT1606373.1 ABC transporter ATP-binding protein [Nesterenkonia massiliensis]